jgi:hypothetical protein
MIRTWQPFASLSGLLIGVLVLSMLLSSCSQPALLPDPTATPLSPQSLTSSTAGTVLTDAGNAALPQIPSPTPNLLAPSPLQIVELQYIQNGQELTVLAKIQNILEKTILRDANYQVLAIDNNGTLLATASGFLKYVFPRELTGFVELIHLQPATEVKKVELRFGDAIADNNLNYRQPFVMSDQTWFSGEQNLATAWLKNLDRLTYTQVAIHAIVYNYHGEIIGGGRSELAFLPELRTIGISCPVTWTQAPARVELYAHLGPYSASLEGGAWWKTLHTESSGFTVSQERKLSGGAILRNRSEQILRQTWYNVTVVDENEMVCASYNAYLPVIWPLQEFAFAVPNAYIPNDCTPAYEDLTIVPGEFGSYAIAYNPLYPAQAILVAEPPNALVRVTVVNNLNLPVHEAQVHVLLRNSHGKITGGGIATLHEAAPNTSTVLDVPVIATGDWLDLQVQASILLPELPLNGQ